MSATRIPVIIYLHGLGSSPEAHKAALFRSVFSKYGYVVEVPNLTVPNFEHLSVEAALKLIVGRIRQIGRDHDIVLLGSSFGAFLGIQSIRFLSEVERQAVKHMCFFAPLLFPWHPKYGLVSPEMEKQWRVDGAFRLPFGDPPQMISVNVSFLEELRKFEPFEIPEDMHVVLYHGERDEVVPIQQSRTYVEMCPHVELVTLDGDHGLFAYDNRLTDEVLNRIRNL
jgi:predicted esterase YcpF (UPF0227 family)